MEPKMAIAKGRPPPGALILSEQEALQKQFSLIEEWQPESEVFYLKKSIYIAAAATIPPSAYLVQFMRKAMRVGKYGKVSSYIAGIAMPAFCSGAAHHLWVTRDVVIHKTDCSSCVAIRSGFLQALLGGVYAAAIVPLGIATFAIRIQSTSLPEKFGHVFSGAARLFRPVKSVILANFLLQFAVGFILSDLETSDTLNIYARFTRMQENIEENSES